MEFYSSHNHSDASNIRGYRDSICTVSSLIKRAIELGYKGISITDHECLSNSIEAINYYYKHLQDTDFKIGIGNEIYLIDDIQKTKETNSKYYHFLLQAKDITGFELLRELSSKAWDNYFVKGIERTPITKYEVETIIGDRKGHLIASTACLGGEFANLVLKYLESKDKEDKIKIHKFLCWCVNTFGIDNFYIELAPSLDPEQIEFNKMAIHIAKAYNIPFILATDSHMLSKDDLGIHSAFINANNKDNENERDSFYQYSYMMSIEEMWEYSKESMTREDFEIAIGNTIGIYDEIQMYNPSRATVVPQMDLPNFKLNHIFKDYYNKYEYIKKFATSEYEQDKYLLYLIEEGFIGKKQKFNEENISRIDIEMKELWLVSEGLNQRMSSYYNLTQFIVNEIMWKRAESIVGIARGSVTGFYVAYLVDITAMSPIPYKLPHWRHLHHSKFSMADIDIDTSALKRPKILEETQKAFGIDNVLNIATFKKEGSKSAVQTAMRGLGFSSDDAQFLSSLIPVVRGKAWTITECLYGNDEDKKPIEEFIKEISKYPKVKEVALGIESLIVGRSVHASGVLIYKDGYIKNGNSLMKAPNGQRISAFDMHISEQVGNLKLDYLTTEGTDLIQTCLELLCKNGLVEWQGSLKATYDKYLHPDVLDYDSKEMFDMLGKGEVLSVFQFSTDIGVASAKKIKPKNIHEMAQANALMRLAVEDGEQPVDMFLRYRNNIDEWYNDMYLYGLNDVEIDILKEHLLPLYGVCSTQEDIMEMIQNPKIANFTMTEADKLRKAIGKKDSNLLEQTRLDFFNKGFEVGNREVFLNYIWYVQFKMSFGYAFSRNHNYPYTAIGIQELNLAYHYPIEYWNCSVLAVNSGALELDEEKNKGKDYGKLANALGEMKSHGVEVKLPDINKSDFTFTIDKESNDILFGLKGISKINDSNCIDIINNRPYNSLDDFCCKMKGKLENGRIVSLIKAGCFDILENKSRMDIMKSFIDKITTKKTNLSSSILPTLIDLKLIPNHLLLEGRFVKFKKYVFDKKFYMRNVENSKTKKYYLIEPTISMPFFVEHFIDMLIEEEDYIYNENGDILIIDKNFEKVYKEKTRNIHQWLKEQEAIDIVNKIEFEGNWNKYVKSNSIAKWEMESVSFYYNKHQLVEGNINLESYGVKDFNAISETPIVVREKQKGDRVFYEYETYTIAGTVIHRDKGKHIVSLLTPTGVVKVKFYKGSFSYYDKTISAINKKTGKKQRIESGWFTRGEQLLIKGYRQEDQFKPKTYDGTNTVLRIEGYQENGLLWLRDERTNIDI